MRAGRCEQGAEGAFGAARDVLRQVIVRRVSRGLDLAGDLASESASLPRLVH